MISSFSSLYQPERRNTWGDSPHYPRSSSSWVPLAPDHRKPPNKISCVSSQHDTYILQYWSTEIFIHLFTCRSPPGVGAGGTGQTVAGKKDNSRYFSFLKNICQMEEYFLLKVCFLPYLHTGQSVSLVGVVTNPLCPSEPSSHLRKEELCFVPSLFPHLYQTPISEGSCSKRAPLLQTYFA